MKYQTAARWSEWARSYLERFVSESGVRRFIAPDVRKWAESRGLPRPPSNYAWGGVFRAANSDGAIVRDGYAEHSDRTMHSQSVNAWRAP